MNVRALALLALLATAGCASFNNPFRRLDVPDSPQEADERVARAETRLAEGDTARALDDLRKARETDGLSTDQKNRIDLLLERCALARIDALSQPGSDPDLLEELFDLNLPRQIAITAGVRAARLTLDQGDPEDAYALIQKVDRRYPPAGTHHERQAAGDILFEAGESLSRSSFSFLGFFRDRDDAQGILEYLVANYPQERRCDQAYRRLAELYEDDRLWQLAIDRHTDLVTYHLESPLAVESEWRIPHLRLESLRRVDFDRGALTRSLRELEAWLEVHAGHELEPKVRADRVDCLRRLAGSDLKVAQFYARVEKWEGARLHAQRALELAKLSEHAGTIEVAERTLAKLPSDGSELPKLPTLDPAPTAAAEGATP